MKPTDGEVPQKLPHLGSEFVVEADRKHQAMLARREALAIIAICWGLAFIWFAISAVMP